MEQYLWVPLYKKECIKKSVIFHETCIKGPLKCLYRSFFFAKAVSYMVLNTVSSRYFEYSISRTLLYPEQYIRSLGHLTLYQIKKLSLSRIFAHVKQSFWSLDFSRYLDVFQAFRNFCNFSSHTSLSSAPTGTTGTIVAIVQARMSKGPQTDFCLFFFFSFLFRFYFVFQWTFFLKILLLKTMVPLETKTYQKHCCWKMQRSRSIFKY